ncbi:MAG: hypothetical protein M5T61_19390 [Acidimicrobiia bacterium]|nr:hypothetical protein [Acidimicrobiia bacterium]
MSFPFSSRTLGYLVDAISSGYSATGMDTLFLKAEVDGWSRVSGSKAAVVHDLLRNLRDDGGRTACEGAFELARLVLAHGKGGAWDEPARWWTPLRDAVAADGWEFDENSDSFVPLVPGAPMAHETSWIEDELRRRGWTTAAGHYRQAVDNFADGNWAAANSQLRSFCEELLRTAA